MDLRQFDKLMHDAEVKLKRLKALYDQWFQGIERREPRVPRNELEKLFRVLHQEKPRNTAARFRLSQLHARYKTYSTMWNRVARQIEEGTFERDVRRVKQRRGGAEEERVAAPAYELDLEEELSFGEDDIANVLAALEPKAPTERPKPSVTSSGQFSAFAPFKGKAKAGPATFGRPPASRETDVRASANDTTQSAPRPSRPPATVKKQRPAAPPAPPPPDALRAKPKAAKPPSPARKAPPPPPPGKGLPATRKRPPPPRPKAGPGAGKDRAMQGLYERFSTARRNNNQAAPGYEKLKKKVDGMRKELQKKHAGKRIDFEVVVRDGKVGLKPKVG